MMDENEKRLRAALEHASPLPWTHEKRLMLPDESVHYAIRTVECMPEHPHSPRFIFSACGSLGQTTMARWSEYRKRLRDGESVEWRSDPSIEADVELTVAARNALPALLAELDALRKVETAARALVDKSRERSPTVFQYWFARLVESVDATRKVSP